MRLITIVSLAASGVLGLGALFVAKAVLPNVAMANPVATASSAGLPMVVMTRDVKYGTRLEPAMLAVIKAPANAVPQGAFTTVAQVLAADRGTAPLVLIPLVAREPVLPAKISGPGSRPSVAAEVAEGMRAYTIKVNDVTGVGGHALPGDHVDVVLMRDLTPTGDQRSYVSQVVLQNVRVLGVDLNADLASDKPASPNTATLEVSVEDAQKLSVAANLGFLSMALRRTGAAEIDEAPLLRTNDFLLGERGGGRAVAATTSRRSAHGSLVGDFGSILVVEGEATKHSRPARAATSLSAPSPGAAAAAAGAAARPDIAATEAVG